MNKALRDCTAMRACSGNKVAYKGEHEGKLYFRKLTKVNSNVAAFAPASSLVLEEYCRSDYRSSDSMVTATSR